MHDRPAADSLARGSVMLPFRGRRIPTSKDRVNARTIILPGFLLPPPPGPTRTVDQPRPIRLYPTRDAVDPHRSGDRQPSAPTSAAIDRDRPLTAGNPTDTTSPSWHRVRRPRSMRAGWSSLPRIPAGMRTAEAANADGSDIKKPTSPPTWGHLEPVPVPNVAGAAQGDHRFATYDDQFWQPDGHFSARRPGPRLLTPAAITPLSRPPPPWGLCPVGDQRPEFSPTRRRRSWSATCRSFPTSPSPVKALHVQTRGRVTDEDPRMIVTFSSTIRNQRPDHDGGTTAGSKSPSCPAQHAWHNSRRRDRGGARRPKPRPRRSSGTESEPEPLRLTP